MIAASSRHNARDCRILRVLKRILVLGPTVPLGVEQLQGYQGCVNIIIESYALNLGVTPTPTLAERSIDFCR